MRFPSMSENHTQRPGVADGEAQGGVPQVKICGLRTPDEAAACAERGIQAVGCVFYPQSPRCVSREEAREIVRSLPPWVVGVGVFVDAPLKDVLDTVDYCGLGVAQLHGRETPEMVRELEMAGVRVIKALFINGEPSVRMVRAYEASGVLIECAGGRLPGGNAMQWDWGAAAGVAAGRPMVLAGGLNPQNVARAIAEANPDAVDVSSGVESAPGRKDLDRVRQFVDAVRRAPCGKLLQRVFQIH